MLRILFDDYIVAHYFRFVNPFSENSDNFLFSRKEIRKTQLSSIAFPIRNFFPLLFLPFFSFRKENKKNHSSLSCSLYFSYSEEKKKRKRRRRKRKSGFSHLSLPSQKRKEKKEEREKYFHSFLLVFLLFFSVRKKGEKREEEFPFFSLSLSLLSYLQKGMKMKRKLSERRDFSDSMKESIDIFFKRFSAYFFALNSFFLLLFFVLP